MALVNYAGASHREAAIHAQEEEINIRNAAGDQITVKRTHFTFLFRDTSVHVAEVESAPALTDEERLRIAYVRDKALNKYVRRVFTILSIAMTLAIIFSCAFMFSNARDQIRYNANYFIAIGTLFVVFPFVSFLIRACTDDEKTSKKMRWICMVPCHLMVILFAAGLCCADLRGFMFLLTLGFICITFIILMLFGFQLTYIYTTWKGLLVVFITHFLLGVIVIPSVWIGSGAEQGVSVLGAVFMSAFFCFFAIYDVMRLSNDDSSFCFNDLKKPEDRDFVWDSVHMYLEFIVFCIIVCIVCGLICVVIICCICLMFSDGD